MLKVLGLPLVGSLLVSCAARPARALVGAWEIDVLSIRMQTYKNSPGEKVITTTAAEWEEKMKSRNIRTYYLADGTYHSVHRNLRDSIVYDPAGRWTVVGDSLFIRDTFPAPAHYRFRLKVAGQVAEFRGVEDFDQDGQVDDLYYSKQRRVKR